MATIKKCSNKSIFFLVAPEVYVQPWANAWLSTPTFEKTRTGYCLDSNLTKMFDILPSHEIVISHAGLSEPFNDRYECTDMFLSLS